jgi:hypothetical protein
MTRIVWTLIGCCVLTAYGCSKPASTRKIVLPAAGTGAAAATAETETKPEAAPIEAAGSLETREAEASVAAEASAADRDGPTELKLDGIRFIVPASWRKVKPQTNIVEAEFELPHVEGDEHDGRLTLMFSGGDPQEVIANRTAEFLHDPDHPPKVESLRAGDATGSWVDLRGEWKGPAFRPVEPRPEYRMLLVIIPFTAHSSFYAKLTGPRETIAVRENEFREFVESAQITPPGFE